MNSLNPWNYGNFGGGIRQKLEFGNGIGTPFRTLWIGMTAQITSTSKTKQITVERKVLVQLLMLTIEYQIDLRTTQPSSIHGTILGPSLHQIVVSPPIDENAQGINPSYIW